MDPLSNTPDVQNKTPDFAAGLLSSLGASFSSGNVNTGLFADLLSQAQIPAPPSPPANVLPPPPPNTQQQSQSSQSSRQSQQNAAANTDSANSTDNHASSTDPSSSETQTPPPGWKIAGKSRQHEAHTHAGKNKTKNTGNQAQPQAQPSAASLTNGQTAATAKAAVAAAPDLTLPSDQNDADTGGNTDQNAGQTANTDPNANNQTGTAPANSNTATDASASSGNSGDTQGSDASSKGAITPAELVLLLQQLERIAAHQLANAVQPQNPDPSSSGGNDAGSGAGTTAAASNGTQEKIDLKGLLDALAELGSKDAANGDPGTQNGGAQINDSQDASLAAATSTAPAQNNAPASANAPSPAAGNNAWGNADFLAMVNNLFNPATANSNPGALPVPNPGSAAGLVMTGGNADNASLDMSMSGQNGTNARGNAADMASAGNNSLPPATGPVPAANPYDFASQLSALRAAKGGATGLPTPIEQVILQLGRGISKDGSSQMTIQLRPAELGRVDVKLNIGSDGKVQGTVTADNSSTLGLLLKDVRGLERALQDAGLRADPGSLQFNLRGDGQPGGAFNQTANNQPGFNGNAPSNSTTVAPVLSGPGETYYLTPGGVNMRV